MEHDCGSLLDLLLEQTAPSLPPLPEAPVDHPTMIFGNVGADDHPIDDGGLAPLPEAVGIPDLPPSCTSAGLTHSGINDNVDNLITTSMPPSSSSTSSPPMSLMSSNTDLMAAMIANGFSFGPFSMSSVPMPPTTMEDHLNTIIQPPPPPPPPMFYTQNPIFQEDILSSFQYMQPAHHQQQQLQFFQGGLFMNPHLLLPHHRHHHNLGMLNLGGNPNYINPNFLQLLGSPNTDHQAALLLLQQQQLASPNNPIRLQASCGGGGAGSGAGYWTRSSRLYSDQTFAGMKGDEINWEAIQSYLSGHVRPGPDVGEIYRCGQCRVEFPNAQAFGGHMSSHSKLKKGVLVADDGGDDAAELSSAAARAVRARRRKSPAAAAPIRRIAAKKMKKKKKKSGGREAAWKKEDEEGDEESCPEYCGSDGSVTSGWH